MRTLRWVAVALVLVLAVSMFSDATRATVRSCVAGLKVGSGELIGELQGNAGSKEAAKSFADWRFDWNNVTVNDKTNDPDITAYVVPMEPKITPKDTPNRSNTKALVVYYNKALKEYKAYVFDLDSSKVGSDVRVAIKVLKTNGQLVSGANYLNGKYDSLIQVPRRQISPMAYTTDVGYWDCMGKCIQDAWPSLPYFLKLICEGACVAVIGGVITPVTAGACIGCLAGTIAGCTWRCLS